MRDAQAVVLAVKPQVLQAAVDGLSFPSGHSLLAVMMSGVLIYLVDLWVRPLLLRRAI